MQCPICSQKMTEQDFGDVMVDVCTEGCKSIWFDWMELEKLDESHEGVGRWLEDALNQSRTKEDNRGKLQCPRCGIPMQRHKYLSSKEVNVDECYTCGGFFLDSGELPAIRETFMSNAERVAYANRLIEEIPEFAEDQRNFEKEKLRTKAIRSFAEDFMTPPFLAGKLIKRKRSKK